jgi:hypothetical protein
VVGVLCRRCHRPSTVLLVVALHMATTEEGPCAAAIRMLIPRRFR